MNTDNLSNDLSEDQNTSVPDGGDSSISDPAAKLTQLLSDDDLADDELEAHKQAIGAETEPPVENAPVPSAPPEKQSDFAKLIQAIKTARRRKRRTAAKKKGKAAPAGKPRKSKKRRIRYERIAVLVAVLLVIVALLILIINGIVGLVKGGGSTEPPAETTIPPEVTTTAPAAVTYGSVDMQYSAIQDGMLLLVNENYMYSFPPSLEDQNISVLENKNQCYMVADNTIMLNKTALDAFNAMMQAFESETSLNSIMLTNAYRSKEYQDMLFNDGTSSAKGGFTEHHTGLCLNISIFTPPSTHEAYSAKEPYSWISDNCASYGFIQRFLPEKAELTGNVGEEDHFRYVGIPHAWYIKQNSLCFEEYLELLKGYSADAPLEFTCTTDGKTYQVYYCAASIAGATSVPYPEGKEHYISGNNMDGFIVTVTQ